MAADPNKFARFWQELKRRRVVHVLIVYATAALVIIELVGNVTEPLQLPAWTPTFTIIVLAIGFPIALIFSWIFDVTPGGIEKTKPSKNISKEEITVVPNSWRIATYISLVVVVVLIVLNIIPRARRSNEKAILDKSIAVLPFINDSPDEEKMYFINGTMEAILDNLCKIRDLRVVSRTSVEQYRNNLKPVPEIAEEMKVSYVLEGSGMKDGENIRLTIQLIDAIHDQHIWSNSYNRKTDEIFNLQSEIAQLVAGEIKAIVSPEEKELIDKKPTSSLIAYDLFQQGREAERSYRSDFAGGDALARAVSLYRQALQYDSTFALAYVGLANMYHLKFGRDSLHWEYLKDSALIFANIALSIDDQLADAYIFKGYYYRTFNESKQALKAWEKAISLNPNASGPYQGMGWLYVSENDFVRAIESFMKAASLNRGPELPALLKNLGQTLSFIGFDALAREKYQEALKLDGDTASYYAAVAYVDYCAGEYHRAIQECQKATSREVKDPYVWNTLGVSYLYIEQYKEALYYLQKYNEAMDSLGRINLFDLPFMAYAYLKNGYTSESGMYVNRQIELTKEWKKRGISSFEGNYLRLSQVYAVTGDKDKTYENLRLYTREGDCNVFLMSLRNSPFFEKMRNESEFQQMVNEAEARYQAEHERVQKWLEEHQLL